MTFIVRITDKSHFRKSVDFDIIESPFKRMKEVMRPIGNNNRQFLL